MVPLAESGSTVWTSPLTQGQAEEDSQRKEEYGTHDSQTCEVVLQHADPEHSTYATETSTTPGFSRDSLKYAGAIEKNGLCTLHITNVLQLWPTIGSI